MSRRRFLGSDFVAFVLMFPFFGWSRDCRTDLFVDCRLLASTFTATTRPVRAHQLFSIPVCSDRPVKRTSGPGQLKMSEGVTACITLASAGGVEGSFFTAQRCSP